MLTKSGTVLNKLATVNLIRQTNHTNSQNVIDPLRTLFDIVCVGLDQAATSAIQLPVNGRL